MGFKDSRIEGSIATPKWFGIWILATGSLNYHKPATPGIRGITWAMQALCYVASFMELYGLQVRRGGVFARQHKYTYTYIDIYVYTCTYIYICIRTPHILTRRRDSYTHQSLVKPQPHIRAPLVPCGVGLDFAELCMRGLAFKGLDTVYIYDLRPELPPMTLSLKAPLVGFIWINALTKLPLKPDRCRKTMEKMLLKSTYPYPGP